MNSAIVTEKQKWWVLIGISLSSFLGCIDLTIVNTALPTIQAELKTSVTQLQWVMNICLLALTAFMVIAGKLADLYGRRRFLYVGMILFAVSSLGAGLSPNIHSLILLRFIQGISIAMLYTIPVAIIPSVFPRHHQGRATGLLIAANGLGLAIGPVLGGVILAMLNWRWIFFINLPIIFLSFIFCWKNLSESKSIAESKKIDWFGFILLALSLSAFILATVEGGSWGWFSMTTLGLYLFSLIAMLAFYFVEKRVKAPIMNFSLFTNKIFIIGLIANFFLAFYYAVDFFFMPLYLHFIRGQTGLHIGLTLLPATAMIALLSAPAGRLMDKHGPKSILLAGYLLLTVSALLQVQFYQQTSLYFIVFAYILFGMGFACILSPSLVAAMSSVPKEVSGVAIGTIGTLHNFGGAIGLALGTVVYRLQAESALISQSMKQHTSIGTWVNNAVMDILNAIEIMQKATHMNFTKIQYVFQQFFLKGYAAAMWLLVASSIITLLIILFGLNKKNGSVL